MNVYIHLHLRYDPFTHVRDMSHSKRIMPLWNAGTALTARAVRDTNHSYTYMHGCMYTFTPETWPIHSCRGHDSFRMRKFSTNLRPSGRIRQVQNTTSCHNSGTMNLNSIRISTVRGHAPYKYPPHNTMPKSPGTNSNPLRISWSNTSFSPTDGASWYGVASFSRID